LKLVSDEGVDRQVVERLRDAGHTVWYFAEMDPSTGDKEVLGLANREGAVLITRQGFRRNGLPPGEREPGRP